MSQKRNPAVARTPGLITDLHGSEIATKINQQLRQIKDAEAVSFEGRFLGFVLTDADGRCDAITLSGQALGRFNSAEAAARALLAEQQK